MIFKAERLILENWMGGTIEINFSKVTNIYGANRAGKSRAKSAYHWVLTGKNSEDKADFEIKDTVRRDNNRLPHRVTLHGSIDGEKVTFEKIYSEVWGNEKGEAEEKLKGHTTKHFYNGNLKTEAQYNELIGAIISQRMLKILSDPLYFPEVLKWNDQRAVLEQMAGITDEVALEKLATPKNDFAMVIGLLNKKGANDKSDVLGDRKSRIKFEISEARTEKDKIQPAIQENLKTIESFGTILVKEVDAEIEALNKKIDAVDEAINDKVKAEDKQNDTVRAHRTELNNIKNAQIDIEQKHTRAFNTAKIEAEGGKSDLQNTILRLSTEKRNKETRLQNLNSEKSNIETSLRNLGAEFVEEGKKVMQPIDESTFKCEACDRKFEDDKIEESKANLKNTFIENKKKRLTSINERGGVLDKQLEENQKLINEVATEIEDLKTQLSKQDLLLAELNEKTENQTAILSVAERLAADADYKANIKRIVELETIIAEFNNNSAIDYSDLKEEKKGYVELLDAEKKKLNDAETVYRLFTRNKDLAEKEKNLAQQIATLQREELEINQFIIGRMELIENAVRSNFQFVSFKMFETNIGDGTQKPACEAWFDGKPFSSLNTEAKLNAGLDILNGLSKFYKRFVPILIDNRESITEILDVESQVINFFVDPSAKTLRVENIQ